MDTSFQNRLLVIYLCGPSPEGKFYVGQTNDFVIRCRRHSAAQGECPNFHAAIRRFGWSAFKTRLLAQTDSLDEADQLERRYITEYNALYPHGYNMTTGGRGTLFDPEARPDPSFTEVPVSLAELKKEGKWRLKHPDQSCPVCGKINSCGVDAKFGRSVLEYFLSGGLAEDFTLGESKELQESLRASVDADWLIILAKETMDVRKAEETLPVVAVQYAQQLMPFIERSMRRSVLTKKGLPTFSQSMLRVIPGSKPDALVFLSAAKLFRRWKRELGTTFESRVNFFQRVLTCFSDNPKRMAIAIRVLKLRGASEGELEEAGEDVAVLGELKAAGEREFQMAISELKDPSLRDSYFDELLLGNDLRNFGVTEDKPSIIVSGGGPTKHIRVLIFSSGGIRRSFTRGLLTLSPSERMSSVRSAATIPDMKVWDFSVTPANLVDSPGSRIGLEGRHKNS